MATEADLTFTIFKLFFILFCIFQKKCYICSGYSYLLNLLQCKRGVNCY